MQTATSETESKSLDLSICVHHYTLRAPCPKGQGIREETFRPPFPIPVKQKWLSAACSERQVGDAVRTSPFCSGCRIPIRATQPGYEHLVRSLPMKQANAPPPSAYQQKPHTMSFLSMYVLCFDAQPHHSGGGSLSMPRTPWCPLDMLSVDALQASDSDATHLKIFLGPVGACKIQET